MKSDGRPRYESVVTPGSVVQRVASNGTGCAAANVKRKAVIIMLQACVGQHSTSWIFRTPNPSSLIPDPVSRIPNPYPSSRIPYRILNPRARFGSGFGIGIRDRDKG